MVPISVLLLSSLCATFILISAQSTPRPTVRDCGPNKEFKECGSPCPANCTHPNGVACIKKCARGCFCKEGYVEYGPDKVCVEKKKCESCTCNTTYSDCGTACPTTCSNRFNKPTFCIFLCEEGCFCKPGYVLLDKDKEVCVLPEDCPPVLEN